MRAGSVCSPKGSTPTQDGDVPLARQTCSGCPIAAAWQALPWKGPRAAPVRTRCGPEFLLVWVIAGSSRGQDMRCTRHRQCAWGRLKHAQDRRSGVLSIRGLVGDTWASRLLVTLGGLGRRPKRQVRCRGVCRLLRMELPAPCQALWLSDLTQAPEQPMKQVLHSPASKLRLSEVRSLSKGTCKLPGQVLKPALPASKAHFADEETKARRGQRHSASKYQSCQALRPASLT